MLRILAFSGLIFLSSCSPFGNMSLIEDISSAIENLFEGEASKTLVAGAIQAADTTALAGPAYKVSASIGEPFTQPTMQTNDGYTVQTSFQ